MNPGLTVDWHPAELPAGTAIAPHTTPTADGHAVRGTLYMPAGKPPTTTTVVVLMHPRIDFSRHYLIPELVESGHAVWAQQARDVGNDLRLVHEQTLLDLAAGMAWVAGLGFRRRVGLGNSGGAALLTYYVQQGLRAAADRIGRTPAGRPTHLAEIAMPALDAMVYLAPHPGQGVVLGGCIDPSVVDEDDPFSVDRRLDPFDPKNGYAPGPGGATYTHEFVERYRAAQGSRIARIDSEARRAVEEALVARRQGDRRRSGTARLVTVWRTDADLRALDRSLDPSPRSFGSVFGSRPDVTNYGIVGFGRLSTPDAWLSTWSATTSNASFAQAGPEMSLPALLVSYTRDNCVFPSDIDAVADSLATAELTRHEIGADHYGREESGRRSASIAKVITEWIGDVP